MKLQWQVLCRREKLTNNKPLKCEDILIQTIDVCVIVYSVFSSCNIISADKDYMLSVSVLKFRICKYNSMGFLACKQQLFFQVHSDASYFWRAM